MWVSENRISTQFFSVPPVRNKNRHTSFEDWPTFIYIMELRDEVLPLYRGVSWYLIRSHLLAHICPSHSFGQLHLVTSETGPSIYFWMREICFYENSFITDFTDLFSFCAFIFEDFLLPGHILHRFLLCGSARGSITFILCLL